MNYEEQSRKDKPFEGLSQEEAKRLFVYMCYIAHPRLTPEDIEKRWGTVLPPEEIPTVFEAMEIAQRFKKETLSNESSTAQDESKPQSTPKRKGVVIALLLLLSAIGIAVWLCGKQEVRSRLLEIIDPEKALSQKAYQLMDNANALLATKETPGDELLKLSLQLQEIRTKVYKPNALPSSTKNEIRISLDELLLKCYKTVRAKSPPVGDALSTRFAVEASYRIALLYLPHDMLGMVREEDKVTSISQNYAVSTNFLQEAVNYNHHDALSLMCNLLERQRDEKSQKRLLRYRHRLADHPNATGQDVYSYLKELRQSGQQSEEQFLYYLKKAAAMGCDDAIRDIQKLRRDALSRGDIFNDDYDKNSGL